MFLKIEKGYRSMKLLLSLAIITTRLSGFVTPRSLRAVRNGPLGPEECEAIYNRAVFEERLVGGWQACPDSDPPAMEEEGNLYIAIESDNVPLLPLFS